jgi:hypothetical protein
MRCNPLRTVGKVPHAATHPFRRKIPYIPSTGTGLLSSHWYLATPTLYFLPVYSLTSCRLCWYFLLVFLFLLVRGYFFLLVTTSCWYGVSLVGQIDKPDLTTLKISKIRLLNATFEVVERTIKA